MAETLRAERGDHRFYSTLQLLVKLRSLEVRQLLLEELTPPDAATTCRLRDAELFAGESKCPYVASCWLLPAYAS
jgi:hypothetical protein